MIIDCIADLHGYLPELPGGDLLIIAGDLTATDTHEEAVEFCLWTTRQKYRKVVYIAGNHDNSLISNPSFHLGPNDDIGRPEIAYLMDNGIRFEGLKIWGSPWTKTFPNMNPHCMAFTCETEQELAAKWALIPKDLDILITHSPPNGVLDELRSGENVGSDSLIKPMIMSGCRLHVYGHVHEAYGKFYNPINGITYINASHVNEHYQPVNKPQRIEL